MAKKRRKKTPDSSPGGTGSQSVAKQKRAARERKRRERMVRSRPLGVKERFMSGCMTIGALAFVLLISALIWHCAFAE